MQFIFGVVVLCVKGNVPTDELYFKIVSPNFHFSIYKSLNIINLDGFITVAKTKLGCSRCGYQWTYLIVISAYETVKKSMLYHENPRLWMFNSELLVVFM